MRVLLLRAAGPWSGAEVHTVNLAKALKETGHEVAIVELGRNRFVNTPLPLPCRTIQLRLGPDTSEEIALESVGFLAWLRALSYLHADVAIAVKGTFKFGSLAMEAAARWCFPCFLVIEHLHAPLGKRGPVRLFGKAPPSLGLWWYRQKVSGFLRSIFPHKVVCVSEAIASTLKDDYCYTASKVVAVHSGVDTNLFVPSTVLRSKARAAWGIPEQAFVFGTVGRLSGMKNHAQLINAFARLHQSSDKREIRLVIVGDGPLRASLESLASSLGVQHSVLFAGFSAEPQNQYQGFDVFCLPSTGEALGIALLEAMSCGCPPIASAVGGVPEILNDPRISWLIPPGSEDDLFSAMQIAMNLDRETLLQKGAGARDRVVRNFNANDRWGELVTVVETAFRRVP